MFTVHGIPQVVHADRGTSMTSKKVADLLADLHVLRSHSRPHVSDNPYSETAFKTVKYHPTFPGRFGSIQDARAFCDSFFTWYNHEHHHTGIGLHTPAAVHYGPRRRDNRRPPTGPGHRLGPQSRTVHPPAPTEIPATGRHRLDQQTRTRHRPARDHDPRCLTPAGLTDLDKFRNGASSQAYQPWAELRDSLQNFLGKTAQNLEAAASAIDQIVQTYAASDAGAASALNSAWAGGPPNLEPDENPPPQTAPPAVVLK